MTLYLRPARSTDAGKIGDILHRFQEETSWMPKLWTGAEAIAFCGTMIDRGWVTVAEEDGRVSAFLSCDGTEICSLYVHPDRQGCGIGKALLDAAKSANPHLKLWTFQVNTGAQRFYLREGFTETERTDGSRNEENLPDIAYEWRATEAP